MADLYTTQQVAEWFLGYNKMMESEKGASLIISSKIQALLYYAQGAAFLKSS